MTVFQVNLCDFLIKLRIRENVKKDIELTENDLFMKRATISKPFDIQSVILYK